MDKVPVFRHGATEGTENGIREFRQFWVRRTFVFSRELDIMLVCRTHGYGYGMPSVA